MFGLSIDGAGVAIIVGIFAATAMVILCERLVNLVSPMDELAGE
jgi:hypothetical protein